MAENILSKWQDARTRLDEAQNAIEEFQAVVKQLQEEHVRQLEALKLPSVPNLGPKNLRSFMRQPYLVMPKKPAHSFIY